jgi:hypothetical protein
MRILSIPQSSHRHSCQHGADHRDDDGSLPRRRQGWTKRGAIRGVNAGIPPLISGSGLDRYVANADVDKMRKALKIAKPANTLLAALAQAANVTDVATAAVKAITPAVATATAAITSVGPLTTTTPGPGATMTGAGAPTTTASTETASTATPSSQATPASAAKAGNQR